jgi:hypothetical protein
MYDGVSAFLRRPLSKHKVAQLKKLASINAMAMADPSKGVGATLALLQSETDAGTNSEKADDADQEDGDKVDIFVSGSCASLGTDFTSHHRF